MHFNEDVVARIGDGGNGTPWFFRGNGGNGLGNTGPNNGFAANNSFSNLLNYNLFYTSGFSGGLQNGANKYRGNV